MKLRSITLKFFILMALVNNALNFLCKDPNNKEINKTQCYNIFFECYNKPEKYNIDLIDNFVLYKPQKVINDKYIDKSKEFFIDTIFWVETFVKVIKEKKDEDNLILTKGLKILMRLFFLIIKFDVAWSNKKNNSLVYYQEQNKSKKFKLQNFYWDFPLCSIISHGGRINFLFENGSQTNFSDLISFDDVKIKLQTRLFSTHGFSKLDDNIIETAGYPVSFHNWYTQIFSKINLDKKTLKEKGWKEFDYRLHNFFDLPFGGFGNYFETLDGKTEKNHSIIEKKLENIFSGHLFFRNGLEYINKKDNKKEIFLIGLENSNPGAHDFWGQSHNINSPKTKNDRYSLTSGHKWIRYKTAYPNLPIPSSEGGKTVYITENIENLKSLYAQADKLVNILQIDNEDDPNKKSKKEYLFKLFASEDKAERQEYFNKITDEDFDSVIEANKTREYFENDAPDICETDNIIFICFFNIFFFVYNFGF